MRARGDLETALEERRAIAERLVSVQNEIAGIRTKYNKAVEKRLNEFLPADMEVSIAFRAGSDTNEFGERLYEMFGARGNQVKKVRGLVAEHTTPVAFARMLLDGDVHELVEGVHQVSCVWQRYLGFWGVSLAVVHIEHPTSYT